MTQTGTITPEAIIEQHTAQYPVDDASNLVEAGMNSLAVMRVANLLRRSGARKATFAKLMEQPTRAAWRALAAQAAPRASALQQHAAQSTAEREDAQPFALTDIQRAYFFGRQDGMPMGGNGCHAYLELEGSGVDAARLREAWRSLFDAHPMLRARFTDDGKQYVAPEPNEAAAMLAVHDLAQLPDAEAQSALLGIRERLAHRKLDVAAGQTCGLSLVNMPAGRTRVCFDIDLLVCDVQSFQLIIRDLARAYRGPDAPAVDPSWDFAAYLRKQGALAMPMPRRPSATGPIGKSGSRICRVGPTCPPSWPPTR